MCKNSHVVILIVTVVLGFVGSSSSLRAGLLRVSYNVPLTEAAFGGAGSPTVFGVAPGDTEFSMAFTIDSDGQFLIPGHTFEGVDGIDVYAFHKVAMSDIEVNFGTLSVSSDDLQERTYDRQGGIDTQAAIAFDEPLTIGASPELFLAFEPPGVGLLLLGRLSGIFSSNEGTTTGLGLGLIMSDATTGGGIELFAGGTVTVVPELGGDFDGNGIVDGHDFLEWQRDTSVGALADWIMNFGRGTSLLAASATVPEPTTCTLALAALCLAMSRRRIAARQIPAVTLNI